MPEQLFTLAQLCERWQVSRETLRKWRESGLLPVVKLGGCVRVAPAAVRSLEREMRSTRQPSPTAGN